MSTTLALQATGERGFMKLENVESRYGYAGGFESSMRVPAGSQKLDVKSAGAVKLNWDEMMFKVSGHTVTLSPVANATDEWYGVYNLTLGTNGTIGLSRAGTESVAAVSPSNLGAEPSYCAAAVDCANQNIIHPMCAPGGWTCNAVSACSFKCGN